MLRSILCVMLAAPPAAATPSPVSDPQAEAATAAPAETVGEPAPEPEVAPAPEPVQKWKVRTFADDPLGVREIVLDNGLTVLLSENHERPEVFGAVVVRTGGKNDPPDNTGMAHYLEHMLFKGTQDFGTTSWAHEKPLQEKLEALYEKKRTASKEELAAIEAEIGETVKKTYAYTVPNETDQLLEEIGGTQVNAFTTYDETVYHNTFPASQIESWLQIYAHRFQNPVFRLFPTELEAVYEEKNIAIDTTGYELFRRFMRGAFPGHPYGNNDILGEVEHLKKPSLKAMKAYFRRWYVPSNMAVVLSGDIDVERVLPMIEATFGAWPKGEDPKPVAHPLAPFQPNQRLAMRASPVRVGAIAFRTVPESHPDYAALLLSRRLLSNEQRSGLVDRLSDSGKVLYAMHVPADLADTNLDVVAYVPRILTQSFRGAEKIVLAQFRRIADGDFDDREFAALKEGLVATETAKWENNRDRALAMAHAYVARGGWDGYVQYLKRLRAVTKADVQRFAAQTFGERRLVLRSRMGFPKKTRLDKPKHPPVQPNPEHSAFFREIREQPKGEPKVDFVNVAADVKALTVQPGVTLLANPNPFNELYHLELRFGVGQDAIRELDVLAEVLERIGTESTRAADFKKRLFRISTTLEATAELDRFVVRFHGPQTHMHEALDLLAELMTHAKIEYKPLRQVRRETWAFRRYARKDPPNVGRALRDHVLYGEDSPYQREYGPAGAFFLSRRKLLKAWDEVQGYAVEVGYVGNVASEDIAAAVRERLPLRASSRPAVPPVVYARNVPRETTVYFVPRRDAVQTQLWFAVEGLDVKPPDRPAADAFSEYFGGSMAGLVFQEVREFRALAYSAHARYWRDESPAQRGHLLGYVGCQADKTFDALDVMTGLITNMPQREGRLELVRSALLRSQETESPGFRELQDTIDEWERLGYAGDPRRALMPAYDKLEFDDIVDFYRRHVAGRPLTIMVVGDPRKVKRSKLKKYGKVVRVREGKLYSN